MGLREKVALLIVALSFVQITQIECGTNTNKLKSQMKMMAKPKRTKWTKSKNLGNPKTAEESLKRRFNFPDVDYPLPPTFISTSYYNPKLDFTKNQLVKDSRDSMKDLAQHRIIKKNRKYNGNFKSPKKSFYVTYPEERGTQMQYCLNGKDLFPSVDYPLDASELWKTHYWERILNTQPEVVQNINEMSTNSKAKMKLAAYKAATKDVLKRNISKSTVNTDVTVNHKEGYKQISQGTTEDIEKISKNPEFALTDRLNPTIECNNVELKIGTNRTEECGTTNGISNLLPCPSSDLSICDGKYVSEELYSIAQVTPSPIGTMSSCHHEYEPMLKMLSPLTTVAPYSAHLNNIGPAEVLVDFQKTYSSDFNSHEVKAEEIGMDLTADEIGCTVMYPEVFSSITTSTMAPIYSDVDSIWMEPELDNHTLNTYSDEVDQYYILV